MKTLFLAVPALLAVMAQNVAAAPAEVSNAGHIQHAAILGVDPALLTESELVRLGNAKTENDAATVAWMMKRAEGYAAAPESTNAGHIQHAANLGVSPALFSETGLVALGTAKAENNATSVAWIENRAAGNGVTTSSEATNAGHVQNAAILGVDPALYSEADLVALGTAMSDNNAIAVAWLKNRAEVSYYGAQ